jgi:hypothetical protein
MTSILVFTSIFTGDRGCGANGRGGQAAATRRSQPANAGRLRHGPGRLPGFGVGEEAGIDTEGVGLRQFSASASTASRFFGTFTADFRRVLTASQTTMMKMAVKARVKVCMQRPVGTPTLKRLPEEHDHPLCRRQFGA